MGSGGGSGWCHLRLLLCEWVEGMGRCPQSATSAFTHGFQVQCNGRLSLRLALWMDGIGRHVLPPFVFHVRGVTEEKSGCLDHMLVWVTCGGRDQSWRNLWLVTMHGWPTLWLSL